MTIKLVDARRSLNQKCKELFSDTKIADQIYAYLCDGIEECDYAQSERKRGKWEMQDNPNMQWYGHWKCDQCGTASHDKDNFCSYCGADMGEGE